VNAARLHPELGLKPPDVIHVATALAAGRWLVAGTISHRAGLVERDPVDAELFVAVPLDVSSRGFHAIAI